MNAEPAHHRLFFRASAESTDFSHTFWYDILCRKISRNLKGEVKKCKK